MYISAALRILKKDWRCTIKVEYDQPELIDLGYFLKVGRVILEANLYN